MGHVRDPRSSLEARLAAAHHPVPSRRVNEDPSSPTESRAGDGRKQTTPDPRPTGVPRAETAAFVLALLIVVVLIALV